MKCSKIVLLWKDLSLQKKLLFIGACTIASIKAGNIYTYMYVY